MKCKFCDQQEQGIADWGPLHYRQNWTLFPDMRERMLRAHFRYLCGPGGTELLRESGYLYEADYLLREGKQGTPLLFRGDKEWLQFMRAEVNAR